MSEAFDVDDGPRRILALEDAAPPGSAMIEEIHAARSDLELRGVLRSGTTIIQAECLAAKYGYRWHAASRSYRRTLRSRVGSPWVLAAGGVVAVLGFVAPFTNNRAVAGGISSVTVLAAFGAFSALRR